jgi:hypothetical protein
MLGCKKTRKNGMKGEWVTRTKLVQKLGGIVSKDEGSGYDDVTIVIHQRGWSGDHGKSVLICR